MQSSHVHENWSSRLAFLLAAIGAAVGLGNIWKFPYMLGTNGGAAFVLVYLVAIFLVATPIMMSEMILGRRGRMSAPNTLRKMAQEIKASEHWKWLGWMGIVGVFLVLSFFSVVAGWSMAYVVKAATGEFAGLAPEQVAGIFGEFLHSPGTLVAWHALFMAVTAFIVSRGVAAGLEKAINMLMPALFIMLVGLVIYSMFAGEFVQAVSFLFAPDFSKITPEVTLAAVGQAFFSLNVGIGSVLVYSAYLPENIDITRSSIIIAVGDTVVALLAGLVIFPMVFAYGLDPGEGPGLLFVTLSAAFAQMPGGQIVGAVFFLLVFVAALTSAFAMFELIICRALETRGISRPMATWALALVAFLFGLLTVFSFNYLEDVHPLGMFERFSTATLFDLIDFTVTNIILPLGGMLFSIFVGWFLSRETTMEELGLQKGWLYNSWRFLTRYVAPAAVAVVFVSNLI